MTPQERKKLDALETALETALDIAATIDTPAISPDALEELFSIYALQLALVVTRPDLEMPRDVFVQLMTLVANHMKDIEGIDESETNEAGEETLQ